MAPYPTRRPSRTRGGATNNTEATMIQALHLPSRRKSKSKSSMALPALSTSSPRYHGRAARMSTEPSTQTRRALSSLTGKALVTTDTMTISKGLVRRTLITQHHSLRPSLSRILVRMVLSIGIVCRHQPCHLQRHRLFPRGYSNQMCQPRT